MDALRWRSQMSAPTLAHSDGMVVVVLDGRTIVFPSEAAARFFYEAYFAVPNLADEAASLRSMIDEGALHVATARIRELEAALAIALADKAKADALAAGEADRCAKAVRRATVLARAVRAVREKL